MPIYEYRCDECASSFETLVRPGHEEDAECPTCHGGRLIREMSVFAAARNGSENAPAGGSPRMGGGACCGGGCGCH